MADDAATVELLQAKLASSLAREAALIEEVGHRDRALAEAREQQTATAEILRVISNSPTELQPVLRAVGERALELLDAAGVFIYLVEGDHLARAAAFGAVGQAEPNVVRPLDRTWVTGPAVLDRRTIHTLDIAAVSEEEYPLSREAQRRFGYHTALA